MIDYIDRQAAIDAIQKLVDKYVDRLDINRVPSMMAVQFGKAEDAKWSAAANSAEKALNIIKAIPSADVVPVVRASDWHYCPNYGARMDGGKRDEQP